MIYSVGDATRNEEAKNWETSIEGQPLKLLVSLYTGTTEFSKLSFIWLLGVQYLAYKIDHVKSANMISDIIYKKPAHKLGVSVSNNEGWDQQY